MIANRNYQPGSIILSNYKDIVTEKKTTGLFFIFYDEHLDITNGLDKDNLLGFKVTTNPDRSYSHAFPLTRDRVPFLKFDSYVLTTKVHTIQKSNIDGVIGVVPIKVLTDFYYETLSKTILTYTDQIQKKIKGEF